MMTIPDDVIRHIAAVSGEKAAARLCKSVSASTWLLDDQITYMKTIHGQDAILVAAKNGLTEAVTRVADDCTKDDLSCAFCIAAENGQLTVVRMLIDAVDPPTIASALCDASQFNHLDVVRELRRHEMPNKPSCLRRAFCRAAACGHVDMIRELRQGDAAVSANMESVLSQPF